MSELYFWTRADVFFESCLDTTVSSSSVTLTFASEFGAAVSSGQALSLQQAEPRLFQGLIGIVLQLESSVH